MILNESDISDKYIRYNRKIKKENAQWLLKIKRKINLIKILTILQ
jgi:hypothetical protein